MKSRHAEPRVRAVQQDLFVETPEPPKIGVSAFEEIRSALAELLLDAMWADRKEYDGESHDH